MGISDAASSARSARWRARTRTGSVPVSRRIRHCVRCGMGCGGVSGLKAAVAAAASERQCRPGGGALRRLLLFFVRPPLCLLLFAFLAASAVAGRVFKCLNCAPEHATTSKSCRASKPTTPVLPSSRWFAIIRPHGQTLHSTLELAKKGATHLTRVEGRTRCARRYFCATFRGQSNDTRYVEEGRIGRRRKRSKLSTAQRKTISADGRMEASAGGRGKGKLTGRVCRFRRAGE